MNIGEDAIGGDVVCDITTHIDGIEGRGDKPTQDELLQAPKRKNPRKNPKKNQRYRLNLPPLSPAQTRGLISMNLIEIHNNTYAKYCLF